MLQDSRAEPRGRGEERRTGAGWAGPYVVLVGEELAVARLECRPEAPGGEGGDGMVTQVAGEAADWKGVTGGSEMAQEAAAGDQGRDGGLDRSGCCGWNRSESGSQG